MAWVDGLTNSQRVLFTMANILTTSNKKLVTKYRKNVDGVVTDFDLVFADGIWKDEESETVNIEEFTKVLVPVAEVDPNRNWKLVYATGGSTTLDEVEMNLTSDKKWEDVNGFDSKRIILKTTTTKKDVDASYDEYKTDPDSKIDQIEMFLEIVKSRYAVNPETNLEETEHPVTGEIMKMENNHYIELRYCDKMVISDAYVVAKLDDAKQLDLKEVNGVICKISKDDHTDADIYTPLAEEEAKKFKAVTIYGDRLLSKEEGGHPSEYSKCSWYSDFRERLVDELDGGPSDDDISKGIVLLPQMLSGMSGAIPIQFWINSNNDRISMVLMGDPTISYDHYMTTPLYIGVIDNFEGDGIANDTAGNFALTVGSSTVPAARPRALQVPLRGTVDVVKFSASEKNVLELITTDRAGKPVVTTEHFDAVKFLTEGWYTHSGDPNKGPDIYSAKMQYVDKKRVGYKFVAYSIDDETNPSSNLDFVYSKSLVDATVPGSKGNASQSGGTYYPSPAGVKSKMIEVENETYSFELNIPKGSKGLRVYKIDKNTKENNLALPDKYVYGAREPMHLVADIDLLSVEGVTEIEAGLKFIWIDNDVAGVIDDSQKPMPLTKTTGAEKSVTRDPILGFVLDVKFPTTWGDGTTATGVSDISMFKTRSGVYNQRHFTSFITPEEYMRKDAFNPSRWTGKFHLSPIYVVHGYDGYRGWLKDTVIVDNTSIVHLDELIVNKDSKDDKKPQEIYKYFKLNTPFSFLNNSPNFDYGIGVLKSKSYTDNQGNKIELYI